jgi:hypothetical protein
MIKIFNTKITLIIFSNLTISPYFLLSDSSKQISTWERRYGTAERAEFAWDIVETDEGSFVVCGITIGKNLFDINGWVIKIDNKGEIIWTKELGGKWQDFLTCVILNKNKELVFTGTKSQSPVDKQVWFFDIG